MGLLSNLSIGLASFSLLLPRLTAEEAAQPLLTALSSTTISGYADVGAHWNPGTGSAVPYNPYPLTEILWQHSDGRVATWTMAGTQLLGKRRIQPPPSPDSIPLQAVALDRLAVLFRHSSYLWLNQALLPVASAYSLKDYSFAGAAQLVGSDQNDLIWNNGAHLIVWEMHGHNAIRQHIISAPFAFGAEVELVGIDKFNADSSPDLLWRDSRGFAGVTLMEGLRYAGIVQLNNGIPAAPGWTLTGSGHFNSDQQPDLLWQHQDGRTAVWFMNGTVRIGTGLLRDGRRVNSGWRIVDVETIGNGSFVVNNLGLSTPWPILRVPQVEPPIRAELPFPTRTNVVIWVPITVGPR